MNAIPKKGDIYRINIKTKNISKVPTGGDFLLTLRNAFLLIPVSAPHSNSIENIGSKLGCNDPLSQSLQSLYTLL